MKRLAIAVLALTASALGAQAQNIGGVYAVDGTNLDGSPYKGTAEVRLTSETTCEIYWTTGGSTSSGICMRNGPAFSAGYAMGDKVGLVIYQVFEDGHMEGLWTIAGSEGLGTEVLTPQ
jgi:hypothetical protein